MEDTCHWFFCATLAAVVEEPWKQTSYVGILRFPGSVCSYAGTLLQKHLDTEFAALDAEPAIVHTSRCAALFSLLLLALAPPAVGTSSTSGLPADDQATCDEAKTLYAGDLRFALPLRLTSAAAGAAGSVDSNPEMRAAL